MAVRKEMSFFPEQIDLTKITDISLSSKQVKKNSIFCAIQGNKFHGLDFKEEVFVKGAKFILSDRKTDDRDERVIFVSDLQQKLPLLLREYYNDEFPQNIIAITGTNGKSSVVNYIQQILAKTQHKSAMLGTLGFRANFADDISTGLTTPDICSFYRFLNYCKKNNCENFSFEASSHALDQGRFAGVAIKIAAFTNLSQDHLDYHQNMENYFQAKAKLFTNDYLVKDSVVVINNNDPYGQKLYKNCKESQKKILTFGRDADISYYFEPIKRRKLIKIFNQEYEIGANFLAEFELVNLACAVAVIEAMGYKFSSSDLAFLSNEKGRISVIDYPAKQAKIVIDFAHTEAALANILKALKPTANNLLLVFGCGGDRDQDKRAKMGLVAEQYADYVIVTDDNPRYENPEKIRKEILQSMHNAKEVADRREAIRKAFNQIEKGDILVIAGKGHEEYQIIKDQKNYFSDLEEVKTIIEDAK